jgi:coenzyme F420-reducing hydrogenase alpha subunit
VNLEGSIDLDLHWDGRAIQRAQVRSSRPLTASRLLQGKTWRQAEMTVPLLFSICGRAQAVAAAGAIEAARGVPAPPAVALQRELRVAAECLQEYAWRILLDLPVLLGEAPQTERFVALRRELQMVVGSSVADDPWWHAPIDDANVQRWRSASACLSASLADHVYGMTAAAWLDLGTLPQIEEWMRTGASVPARLLAHVWPSALGRSAVARLPQLDAAAAASALAQHIAADSHFAGTPQWGDAPAETGALARTAGHPLIRDALAECGNTVGVRLLARFVELALLDQRIHRLSGGDIDLPRTGGAAIAPGIGLSATETARGILLHYVELQAEQVARYRIVAPTEWNFHPHGAFVEGMRGAEADSEQAAQQAARLMAHALDPCVAYRVQVIHA